MSLIQIFGTTWHFGDELSSETEKRRDMKIQRWWMPETKVATQPAELRCSLSPGLTWVPVGIYLEEIRVFHVIAAG